MVVELIVDGLTEVLSEFYAVDLSTVAIMDDVVYTYCNGLLILIR
jgi:hypothetical protein